MLNRRVVFLVIAVQLVFTVAVSACPYCSYSPNGWGFCKYNGYAGAYDCDTRVEDPWTGRTKCVMCGYCNWGNSSSNQPCDNGFEDCGISTPCDDAPIREDESLVACSNARPVMGSGGLSWMGARTDQVLVF